MAVWNFANIVAVSVRCRNCRVAFEIPLKGEDLYGWIKGNLAQAAFPYLRPQQREMLISGMCESCFDKAFPDSEGEYE